MAKKVVAKKQSVKERLETAEALAKRLQEVNNHLHMWFEDKRSKVDELTLELAELRRMSERQDKIIKDTCVEATKWRARADAYLNALVVAGGQITMQ